MKLILNLYILSGTIDLFAVSYASYTPVVLAMPELWVNIVIVLLLSTCVVGMLWSGMRILRLRRERQQHVEVVQSRMSARVSARSATLPAVHA